VQQGIRPRFKTAKLPEQLEPTSTDSYEPKGESHPSPREAFMLALDDQLQALDSKWMEETGKPAPFKERKRVIREVIKSLADGEVRKDVEKEYEKYVLKRQLHWPPKWLTDFGDEITNKKPKHKLDTLWIVYDCRWRHNWKIDWKIDRDKCIRLAARVGLKDNSYVTTFKTS
jgi:hypothetical protein